MFVERRCVWNGMAKPFRSTWSGTWIVYWKTYEGLEAADGEVFIPETKRRAAGRSWRRAEKTASQWKSMEMSENQGTYWRFNEWDFKYL